jgi:hypothetical protein
VSNQRRLVGPVVVHDEMHIEVTRHGGVHGVQELPKLDRARRARCGAVRDRCANESSRTRTSSVRISATFGRPSAMLASL